MGIMFDKNVEFYRKGDYLIRRDKYLNQLIDSKDNGFPKVITGIRRCGKSFLMKDIYREYLLDNGIEESSILVLELAYAFLLLQLPVIIKSTI